MSTRTRAERRDELVEALACYGMDMPRLHHILSTWPGMAAEIEGVIAQTDRTHGEVAAAYVTWVEAMRGQTAIAPATVDRIAVLLAQPPLIPLSAIRSGTQPV